MCDGPLIWFDASPPMGDPLDPEPPAAGILECTRCGYIIVTGNWHDEAHALTPFIRA